MNGTKQGGVLSPILFAVYINDILERLKESGIGCYLSNNYVGGFAFADNDNDNDNDKYLFDHKSTNSKTH